MELSHAQGLQPRMNIVAVLSGDVLELIGKKLDQIGLVGIWNQVLASHLRTTLPREFPGVAMLSKYLLHGEFRQEESNSAAHSRVVVRFPAIFHALQNIQNYNNTHHAPLMHDSDFVNLVTKIVQAYPAVLMERTALGNTPLHWGICESTMSEEVLLPLLQNPRDLSQKFNELLTLQNIYGLSPLHLALERPNCSCFFLHLLVDRKQDVLFMRNHQRATPLNQFLATTTERGIADKLCILTPAHPPEKRDRLLKCVDYRECTPLHSILRQGMVYFADYGVSLCDLIDTRQEVLCLRNCIPPRHSQSNIVDDFQRNTPLHTAIQERFDSVTVGILVDTEQQVLRTMNSVDDTGLMVCETPLHLALRMDSPIAVLRKLVDTDGHVLRITNYHGDLPLHTHLRIRHEGRGQHRLKNHVTVSNALLLITYYMDLEDPAIFLTPGKNGDLPLHTALRNDFDFRVVSYLVKCNRAALTVKNQSNEYNNNADGDTPLSLAVKYGYSADVLRFLIDRDKTVTTIEDANGEIPLHHAFMIHSFAAQGYVYDIMSLLVQTANEVDPRQCCNKLHRNALHLLLLDGPEWLHGEMVGLLTDPLQRVLYAQDIDGNTPLHLALLHGAPKYCIELLRTGRNAPIDVLLVTNAKGQTPLHVAVATMHSPLVWSMLIDSARTVCAVVDKENGTPLHTYIAHNTASDYDNHVQLLRRGPDTEQEIIMMCNEAKMTPLQFSLNNKKYIVNASRCADCFRLLIDANQNALRASCAETRGYPIHTMLTNCRDESESTQVFEGRVLSLIDRQRTVLLHYDSLRRLPLHIAIETECSIKLVQRLIPPMPIQKLPIFGGIPGQDTEAYIREAAVYLNLLVQYGCSPLHMALDRVSDDGLKIVEILSEKFKAPEYNMQSIKDCNQMTPIEKILSGNHSREKDDVVRACRSYM